MKLIDIAKKIDKSDKNMSEIDISKICEQLDINFYGWIEQNRLKCYWIGSWYCTETQVGYRMYFLDNELVALSIQNGRKSDERIKWINKKAAEDVKNYIIYIIPREELFVETFDLNEDIGNSFKIEFNNNIIDWSKARYHGEKIEFIKRIRETPDYGIDDKSLFRMPNGEEKIININDIDFLFNIKE